jgi:hypothetical protein
MGIEETHNVNFDLSRCFRRFHTDPAHRARHMLPTGFSQVSIGKRHVEILRANFGIDYIDGDGRGANLGVEVEEVEE